MIQLTSTVSEIPFALAPIAGHRTTPPINVLHVINGEHFAGAERVQDLLARNLGQFGYRVEFVCLKSGRFEAMRASTDSPLHHAEMRHRLDLRPAREIARIVRAGDFRLIHSHTARSALIAAAASIITGTAMIHHVHSPTVNDTTHRVRNWINSAAERLVLRRARALIAVSAHLGGYVREQGFDSKKVFVVPNGVAARKAVPIRDSASRKWTLGVVALFRPRKGLEVLLQAVSNLRRQGIEVRLRAVGSFETPDYEARIKSLASDLGISAEIDWVGFAKDIDQELAKMDLFVLPSLFGEGLPMVILEAMSAGLPVVASAVPGVPEALVDEEQGLLVEPGNPDDLTRAIGRFIAGEIDWNAIHSRAILRHRTYFSEANLAAGVASVYDEVLQGRGEKGRTCTNHPES